MSRMLLCEADVADGLEQVAHRELLQRFKRYVTILPLADPYERGVVRFAFSGDLQALGDLKTVLAVFLLRHFAVPRPKALLGDQFFRMIVEQIGLVVGLQPAAFSTLYLSAAGAESTVMSRLKTELASRCGLRVVPDEGDLLLRVRPARTASSGWETLVRLTPRPLSTRAWRVCNLEGAMNATVAHAMVLLARYTPSDTVLNICCGSGTLLIERALAMPAQRIIGCDIAFEALACARANLVAAKLADSVELHDWDARALPLPDCSIDLIYADLPFGQLVGSHTENLALYPAVLREATRVATPQAVAVLLSHEIRLMERVLADSPGWQVQDELRVTLGGLHPRIFVLHRVA